MHNWSWLGKWEVAPVPLRGGVPPFGLERRAWSRSSQCGGRSEVEVRAAGPSALGVCNWGEGISWAVPGAWWLPQSHLTFVVLQTQPSCLSPLAVPPSVFLTHVHFSLFCFAQGKSEVLLRCEGTGQVSGARCCGQSTGWWDQGGQMMLSCWAY